MGHTDYAFTQGKYQSAELEDLRKITSALSRPGVEEEQQKKAS